MNFEMRVCSQAEIEMGKTKPLHLLACASLINILIISQLNIEKYPSPSPIPT